MGGDIALEIENPSNTEIENENLGGSSGAKTNSTEATVNFDGIDPTNENLGGEI